jgi:hypothetical protein
VILVPEHRATRPANAIAVEAHGYSVHGNIVGCCSLVFQRPFGDIGLRRPVVVVIKSNAVLNRVVSEFGDRLDDCRARVDKAEIRVTAYLLVILTGGVVPLQLAATPLLSNDAEWQRPVRGYLQIAGQEPLACTYDWTTTRAGIIAPSTRKPRSSFPAPRSSSRLRGEVASTPCRTNGRFVLPCRSVRG